MQSSTYRHCSDAHGSSLYTYTCHQLRHIDEHRPSLYREAGCQYLQMVAERRAYGGPSRGMPLRPLAMVCLCPLPRSLRRSAHLRSPLCSRPRTPDGGGPVHTSTHHYRLHTNGWRPHVCNARTRRRGSLYVYCVPRIQATGPDVVTRMPPPTPLLSRPVHPPAPRPVAPALLFAGALRCGGGWRTRGGPGAESRRCPG